MPPADLWCSKGGRKDLPPPPPWQSPPRAALQRHKICETFTSSFFLQTPQARQVLCQTPFLCKKYSCIVSGGKTQRNRMSVVVLLGHHHQHHRLHHQHRHLVVAFSGAKTTPPQAGHPGVEPAFSEETSASGVNWGAQMGRQMETQIWTQIQKQLQIVFIQKEMKIGIWYYLKFIMIPVKQIPLTLDSRRSSRSAYQSQQTPGSTFPSSHISKPPPATFFFQTWSLSS